MNEANCQEQYYHFVRFAAASEQEYYARKWKGEVWRQNWLRGRNDRKTRVSKGNFQQQVAYD